MTIIKIGKRKGRIFVQNMEQTVTEEEIEKEIQRQVGSEEAKVIFIRNGNMGNKNACVAIEEEAARDAVQKGWIRIGWSRCRVSKYEARYKCFQCGGIGHTRVQCKSQEKLCYKCGSPGHDAKECKDKEVVEERRGVPVEGRREAMEEMISKEIGNMRRQLGIRMEETNDEGVTQMDKAIEEALRDIRGSERVGKGGSEEKREKGREKCEEVRGTQLQKEDWMTVKKKSRQNTA
ncbi:hypothetical protein WH47_11064 [Habropoda laboriosa]|uniref:CCHC-type domain-containing protein n=1 Tax=Habropoda laboriosa TaxID=597456 RepID=A0A0L7QM42_9HYME|nr:hypothetical protein WH47_11064 [Habropoda laboriosa]